MINKIVKVSLSFSLSFFFPCVHNECGSSSIEFLKFETLLVYYVLACSGTRWFFILIQC